jgi:hypothetical protein
MRIKLLHVKSNTAGDRTSIEVEVALAIDGRSAVFAKDSPAAPGALLRLGALAALDAAGALDPQRPKPVLEDVTTVTLAHQTVVIASLLIHKPTGWHRLYGASGVGDGSMEAAAARAVLAAINRDFAES